MSRKKYANAQKILDALITHWKLDGYPDLARHIDVPYQTVMAWKKRGRLGNYIPFIDKGISVDWLESGEGGPFPQPKPEVSDPGTTYREDPRLSEIRQLWGSICHQQRDALLAVAQGFAKQQPQTSPENGAQVIDLYEKRSA